MCETMHEPIRLTISAPAEPIVVDADLTRLAQVFLNLLNNAAKFRPDVVLLDIGLPKLMPFFAE